MLSLSVLQAGNSSNILDEGKHRASLVCFLDLRDHCPWLSDIQCLEDHCFIYFVSFSRLFQGRE